MKAVRKWEDLELLGSAVSFRPTLDYAEDEHNLNGVDR